VPLLWRNSRLAEPRAGPTVKRRRARGRVRALVAVLRLPRRAVAQSPQSGEGATRPARTNLP
jgi:hypothetical protein